MFGDDYDWSVKIDRMEKENARLREELEGFVRWAEAYLTDIFPEPDHKRAHELLQAGALTLDAVSASVMRSALGDIGERARAALAGRSWLRGSQ